MLGFISEELVWALAQEREEEARRVRPHTAGKPDPERSSHESDHWRAQLSWNAPAIRHSVHRARA
jgi:hypothetical protein